MKGDLVHHADVFFVFDVYTILVNVPYDGTYNDAVQRAIEWLHHDDVSVDGATEIYVEDTDTLGLVSE